MTRLSVKALILITLMLGISSLAARADVDLTDGIIAFVCDGETLVLEETDAGWLMPIDPTAEIVRTKNGWRHEDPSSGRVWYLREEGRNSWVVEMLSADGYEQTDCIHLESSIREVVEIIKPKIQENIKEIQSELLAKSAALAQVSDDFELIENRNKWLKRQLAIQKEATSQVQQNVRMLEDIIQQLLPNLTARTLYQLGAYNKHYGYGSNDINVKDFNFDLNGNGTAMCLNILARNSTPLNSDCIQLLGNGLQPKSQP